MKGMKVKAENTPEIPIILKIIFLAAEHRSRNLFYQSVPLMFRLLNMVFEIGTKFADDFANTFCGTDFGHFLDMIWKSKNFLTTQIFFQETLLSAFIWFHQY